MAMWFGFSWSKTALLQRRKATIQKSKEKSFCKEFLDLKQNGYRPPIARHFVASLLAKETSGMEPSLLDRKKQMLIQSPADLLPLIGIATAILAGVLWLIRAQFSILREFRPNSGTTMKDALSRIEVDVREVRTRLDSHIDNHNRAA